jgi:hypothetical protein
MAIDICQLQVDIVAGDAMAQHIPTSNAKAIHLSATALRTSFFRNNRRLYRTIYLRIWR